MDLGKLLSMQKDLLNYIPHGHAVAAPHQPIVIAAIGIIEETLEFLNAIGFKTWRPNPLPKEAQLEELTDILFFYLELIHFSGFTLDQLDREYQRKWEVNMERYRKAKAGDWSWDNRGKKEGL